MNIVVFSGTPEEKYLRFPLRLKKPLKFTTSKAKAYDYPSMHIAKAHRDALLETHSPVVIVR
jgi:hypothetical protein